MNAKTRITAIVLVALFGALLWFDVLWRWDWVAYDSLIAMSERDAPASVVLVAIDERSVAKLGRWPWRRAVHAELIRRLSALGARTIVLNVLFSEPDAVSPEDDALLAAAMEESRRVVLPISFGALNVGGKLTEILPIPTLKAAAARLGHVDAELDPDGVVRGIYLKAGLGGANWSALSLAGLEQYRGAQLPDPLPGERNPNRYSPGWDAWVRDYHILIPFAGPPGHFNTLSYVDVLSGHVPPGVFRDKLVLVGISHTNGGDALATPVSGGRRLMPGIEVHANAMDALQLGIAIESMPWQQRLPILLTLVLGSALLSARYRPSSLMLCNGGAVLLLLALSYGLLRFFHVWLAPMPALLTLIASHSIWSWRHWESMREALVKTRSQATLALESIGEAVIATDVHGQIEFANQAGEKLFGKPFRHAQGGRLEQLLRLVHGQESDAFNPVHACIAEGRAVQFPDRTYLLTDNAYQPVLGIAEPIFGTGGQILGAILVVSDGNAVGSLRDQTRLQATHDVLTRLPNRILFYDRLAQAISMARRNNELVGVFLIDIDRFRAINENFGSSHGDQLLADFAGRLSATIRECDTLARLSGDQFGIVLQSPASTESVRMFAMRLLGFCQREFSINERSILVTATIGVAVFPHDGDVVDALLARADTAVATGKEMGGNRYQFYARPLAGVGAPDFLLEQDLRLALRRDQLHVLYQPQVDISTGKILGVEALLRWHHPERGDISPEQFIGLAERSGLIEAIGGWVLQQACFAAKRWQDAGFAPIRIAVNLSPRQFLDQALLARIEFAMSVSGLKPCSLELEITEGLLLKDTETVAAILDRLQSMGIGVAIDDFGTGYASLSYLRRFPVSKIKIDKSFVRDLPSNTNDEAIVQAVIKMAESLKIDVIAEGVESAEQLAILRKHGCRRIQGYFFSHPLSDTDLLKLLREQAS